MGQKDPSTKDELLSSTPYDDVHRTMENDCRKWLIPLMSEVFQENLDEYNDVVFTKETHFMNHEGGGEEKRITDGSFRLIIRDERTKEKISDKEKKYLCECQTNADSSILIRMFEYATQTALDELAQQGVIEEYAKKITQEMSVKVLANLAVKYDRLRKEVGDVMGGKVIMTEATRILNQGRAEGRAEGKAETLFENMQALMETMKLSAEQALAALKVPEDQYPKYLSMLK